jgi:hypothetical protein
VQKGAVAAYFDPESEQVVRVPIATHANLDRALTAILGKTSGRGHPSLELQLPGGRALSIGTDGTDACLVWRNGVEESFHSVGGKPGPELVFDYMGSWSAVPREWAVPLQVARECLVAFMELGEPSHDQVMFEPD